MLLLTSSDWSAADDLTRSGYYIYIYIIYDYWYVQTYLIVLIYSDGSDLIWLGQHSIQTLSYEHILSRTLTEGYIFAHVFVGLSAGLHKNNSMYLWNLDGVWVSE